MKRKYTLAAAVVLAALLVGVMIYTVNHDFAYDKMIVDLYFMNEAETGIVAESSEIKYKNDIELTKNVLEKLRKGSSVSKRGRIMPKDTKVNTIEMAYDGNVTVDFSESFLSDDPLKNVLHAYAVTKTLCSTGKISQVRVTVCGNDISDRDGNQLGFVAASDINLETEEYSSELRKIVLYFASDSGFLSKEERTVKITDQQPIEQYIINELIKGPDDKSLRAPLSRDTILISADVEDNICYLNFKSNFIKENSGSSEHERLVIYSMVNSLTELQTISRVQFYMDGRRVDSFGDFPIKGYISRDASIIQ